MTLLCKENIVGKTPPRHHGATRDSCHIPVRHAKLLPQSTDSAMNRLLNFRGAKTRLSSALDAVNRQTAGWKSTRRRPPDRPDVMA